MLQKIIPLQQLPTFRLQSPGVVRVLDRIRKELDHEDLFAEFTWFAREYPRVYRHHFDHAEHRLKLIYEGYEKSHNQFVKQIEKADNNLFSTAHGGIGVMQIHWDFEAYLNCIGSALDVLARIVGTGYPSPLPISFNKICSSKANGELVDALRTAKKRWVDRMKDYRDCFVHYTPSETLIMISCNLYSNGWETRLALPVNPNCRDIMLFRYSRRSHILKYAITVYKHLIALDRKVARIITKHYSSGNFPNRINNLFFLGGRSR